jgi:large subunit ribosomal protein L21
MGGFAIFKAGGRQIKASEGDTILVDHLNAQPGDEVRFDKVLLIQGSTPGVAPEIGSPHVTGAVVVAEVEDEVKDDKKVVFKFKRRKQYSRKAGHRQRLTRVKVKRIESE